MNEEIKKEEAESLILKIELHPDGQLSVNCPALGDTLFMLGLLEMAKAIVFQYKQNQAKVIRPQNGIMGFVRRKF